jgi:hypothetical protein
MRRNLFDDSEPFALLFEKAQQGSHLAQNAFYRMTFRRLRAIARMLLAKERAGHTLQTALVSERAGNANPGRGTFLPCRRSGDAAGADRQRQN